ncbi:hypothetical protein ACKKBG_A04790 [Auxenochlorella protothecoides x Auxenochlorella symbiontica]
MAREKFAESNALADISRRLAASSASAEKQAQGSAGGTINSPRPRLKKQKRSQGSDEPLSSGRPAHSDSLRVTEPSGSLESRLLALARVADSNDSPGQGPFRAAGAVAQELRAWIQGGSTLHQAGSPAALEAVRELENVACSLHHDALGLWRLSQAALRVQCMLSQHVHSDQAEGQATSAADTEAFISRFYASFQEELGAMEAEGTDVSPDVLRDTVASWACGPL